MLFRLSTYGKDNQLGWSTLHPKYYLGVGGVSRQSKVTSVSRIALDEVAPVVIGLEL